MRKRMVSISLVLCLAISLVVPAYAAENSVSSKMEKDYEAMEAVFIDLDSVSVSSTENGIITYAYQLEDLYTDYIIVQHNDDGSSILNIQEGDNYNTITVLSDGNILIDGEELVPPTVYSSAPPEITPRVAFSYAFSENPFGNTTPSQYYVGTYYQNCPDIGLAQDIRKVTGATIGLLLGVAFFPTLPAAQKASVKICKKIATTLKSKAEIIATDIVDAVSYKMRIDGHPNNDSFTLYREYTGTYYFDENYTGGSFHAAPFYELRTTLS